jgi:DNA-directed RNA polymerase subunit RPC12/RpoP
VIPILGVIAALLYRRESETPLRRCPACGSVVRIYDALCMKCGTDLDYPSPSEIIEPDPSIRVRAKL